MKRNRAEVHIRIDELLVDGFAANEGDLMREAIRRQVERRLKGTPAETTTAASATADAVHAASTKEQP